MSSDDYFLNGSDDLDPGLYSYDWQHASDSHDTGGQSANQPHTAFQFLTPSSPNTVLPTSAHPTMTASGHLPSDFSGYYAPATTSQAPRPFGNDMLPFSSWISQPNHTPDFTAINEQGRHDTEFSNTYISDHAASESTLAMTGNADASSMFPPLAYSSPIQPMHATGYRAPMSSANLELCPECQKLLYSQQQHSIGQLIIVPHGSGLGHCIHSPCSHGSNPLTTTNETPYQSLSTTEVNHLSYQSPHTTPTITRPDPPRPPTSIPTTPSQPIPTGVRYLCIVPTFPRSQPGLGFGDRNWNRDLHVGRGCAEVAAVGISRARPDRRRGATSRAQTPIIRPEITGPAAQRSYRSMPSTPMPSHQPRPFVRLSLAPEKPNTPTNGLYYCQVPTCPKAKSGYGFKRIGSLNAHITTKHREMPTAWIEEYKDDDMMEVDEPGEET